MALATVALATVALATVTADGVRRAEDRQRRADRDHAAGGRDQLLDDGVLEGLDVHRGLLGVDHRDDVPAVHPVPRTDEPLEEGAFGHVRSERGHPELAHDGITSWTAATTRSTDGSAASSRWRAYGMGTSALHTRTTGASSS